VARRLPGHTRELEPGVPADRDTARAGALAARASTAAPMLSRLEQFLQQVGCSDPNPVVARAAIERQSGISERDRAHLLAMLDTKTPA
jgi:hypothetical protein